MGKVISLLDRKRERQGEMPLQVSYLDGEVNNSGGHRVTDEDFSARMARIRQSLEKINTLMADLKKTPRSDT